MWQSERELREAHESSLGDEESGGDNISPPIHAKTTENPKTHTVPSTSQSSCPATIFSPLPDNSLSDEAMANFAVNPEPFLPMGMEVEDWARPARGRIVVYGNPLVDMRNMPSSLSDPLCHNISCTR